MAEDERGADPEGPEDEPIDIPTETAVGEEGGERVEDLETDPTTQAAADPDPDPDAPAASGVEGYPRWHGELSTGRAFPTIARQEITRTWNDLWGRIAIVFVIAYALVFIGSLNTVGPQGHTMDNALRFVDLLRWGALVVAAIMAGPALLEDRLHGALELYLSRAVTRVDYLVGKIGAVLDLTAVVVVVPGIVYWVATYFLFTEHPEAWTVFPLAVIVYGLLWAVMVSGLALGLACVSRSSRATALILFAVFAIADVLITDILEAITRSEALQVLSPFSAHGQQVGWLFQAAEPFGFPYWWGLIEIVGLIAVGWALVWWKHPRLAGVET